MRPVTLIECHFPLVPTLTLPDTVCRCQALGLCDVLSALAGPYKQYFHLM